MDPQIKKGFLEFCVLASLARKDSYGYQIVKEVSTCIEISESTLYPILKRLESKHYVSTYSVEHNHRLRRYYQISHEGRKRLLEFLEQWQQIENIYHYIKGELSDE